MVAMLRMETHGKKSMVALAFGYITTRRTCYGKLAWSLSRFSEEKEEHGKQTLVVARVQELRYADLQPQLGDHEAMWH